MRIRASTRWRLLGALLALLPAGCSISNLNFTADDRLHFTAPHSRALVEAPVTLSWTMSGFRVAKAGSAPPSRDAGYFALFVDRSPVQPGQSLLSLADKSCKVTPGCFNAQFLAERGVYTTASTSFTITQVPALSSYQDVQLHEVTIVLMDTEGRRIGESAWYVDFRMKRPTY